MPDSCLLRGACVVSDGAEQVQDVRIEGERIVEVGSDLPQGKSEVLDCAGLHLLPGLIDDQVHFREPGMEHKACIASESAAAVAGGVTSFLEMPNTDPPTADPEALADKLQRAAAGSVANYGFYLGATGSNSAALREASDLPACGIKVFLAASTGSLLVDDDARLEEVFANVPAGMVLAAHCEDNARIRARLADAQAEHGEQLPMDMHPIVRDHEGCLLATQRAIALARKHGTRLHVLHISTADELAEFSSAQLPAGKQITAEACVHHLWFSDQDYAELGGRIKCNPAIKTSADRAALRAALADGRIDVVATDHAPHLLAEKQGDYSAIAAGLPLVQHSLLVLLTLAREGAIDLADIARLGAHHPAELFGIAERGHIREGYFADLALVDLGAETVARDSDALSKCGWTPFDGVALAGQIRSVWVSGKRAVRDGAVDRSVRGMQLAYQRHAR